MKKAIWGALFLVALFGVYWLLLPQEENKQVVPLKDQVEFNVKNNKKEAEELGTVYEIIPKPELGIESGQNETLEKEELSCSQRYQQKPEWKEIEAVISAIYMNGDEAAGEGTFQQLPLEAVKSYADAGNKDAMFHYGSEVMWKAAFGVHLNTVNREPILSSKDFKQQVQDHKPDFELFLNGADYAYQSALQGRLGGILEITAVENGFIRRMVKSEFPASTVEDVLVHRLSYLKLMEKIHANDPGILTFFRSDNELKKGLDLIYGEENARPEIKKKIENKTQELSERLLSKWKADRKRLGFAPFPDVMDQRLDQFLMDMKQECGA